MPVKIWVGTTDTDPTVAGNWDPSGVPADNDSIIVPATTVVAMAGADLTSSGTIQFEGFDIEEGYGQTIGSSSTYLQIDMKTGAGVFNDVNIAATAQVFLDIDNYGTINVTRASTASTGQFGVNLIGLHDDATATDGIGDISINLSSSTGTVSIGANADEDMEVIRILVTEGTVTIGSAITEDDDNAAPDIEVSGGTIFCSAPMGVVTINGGNYSHQGSATLALLQLWNGTVFYESSGTLTLAQISGTIDMSNNLASRTFSVVVLYRGGTIRDPYKTTTFSADIDVTGVSLANVTLDLGTHITIARGTI